MLTRKLALVAACAFTVCAAATEIEAVATLSKSDGVVMVNAGERFVNASAGQQLRPGDRVMVLAGAEAEVTFADACVMPLGQNTIAVVPEQSTCAGAVADVRSYGPQYAQAVGSSATADEAVPPDDDVCFGENDLDDEESDCVGWWIVGGALAGWAIYEALDDDDRSPISN